eukprot:TRINITY_DN5146_c0_g1_i5.p1 TRINITY_DN5146_c0_g1~~TRINITY_DN5146_c0_g1_i5.p1  ORF type:complete len:133 (+),score=19.40 TRINITY_DN5146_c0_g1_i5:38-436(+)
MVKFADETTLEGLITTDESNYRDEVLRLVKWCDHNNLELNVSKTKEMILDFRKTKADTIPLLIKDKQVDVVSEFKFLELVISDHLKWENKHICLFHCQILKQRVINQLNALLFNFLWNNKRSVCFPISNDLK